MHRREMYKAETETVQGRNDEEKAQRRRRETEDRGRLRQKKWYSEGRDGTGDEY